MFSFNSLHDCQRRDIKPGQKGASQLCDIFTNICNERVMTEWRRLMRLSLLTSTSDNPSTPLCKEEMKLLMEKDNGSFVSVL